MLDVEKSLESIIKAIRLGKIEEAIDRYEKLESLDTEKIDQPTRAEMQYVNALLLSDLGNLDEAINSMKQLYQKISEITKVEQKVKYLTYYATLMVFTGTSSQISDVSNQIEEYVKEIKTSNVLDHEPILADYYNLKGLIFNSKGDYDNALQEFDKALAIQKKHNHRKDEGAIQFNMGILHRQKGNIKLSKNYFDKSISLFESLGYYTGLEQILKSAIEMSKQVGDENAEFEYSKKLREARKEIDYKNSKIQMAKQRKQFGNEIATLHQERLDLEARIWELESKSGDPSGIPSPSPPDTEIESLRLQLEELAKSQAEIQEELDLQTRLNQELNEEVSSLKSKGKISDTEVENLKSMNNGYKEEINKLQKVLEESLSERDRMKNEKNAWIREKEELLAKPSSPSPSEKHPAEKELEILKDEYKSLKEELNHLNTQLKEKEVPEQHIESVENFQTQLEELREENTRLKNTLKEEKMKMNDLTKELDDINAKVQKEKGELEFKLESATSNLPKLQEEVISLKTELAEKEQEIQVITEKSQSRTLLSETYEEQINEMKEKHVKAEVKINELSEENSKLKESLQSFRATLEKSELEIQKHKDWEDKYHDVQNELAKSRGAYSDLLDEKSKLEERITDLEEKLERSEKKMTVSQIATQPSPEPKTIGQAKFKQETKVTLEKIVNESNLARMIYELLEIEKDIPLRRMAMILGTSPAKCLDEIKRFERIGVLRVQKKFGEDSNPTIYLNVL